ncbi:MAG: prepilin-type N-terminal cleavage/methylation domain-containing protein [Hyphomicrobiaceae bacterium]|nr:prepilin-type N-terminal cleavage/methylation domain-containing protein [Hyphomicrobiaceae bacterium]
MTGPQQQAGPLPSQQGFTLIELLVGLTLFAVVLSLIPGTLQLGRRAWEDTARSDRSAQVAGVRSFLEQRLAETLPVTERVGDGRTGLAFHGRHDALMFVSPAPDGPAGAGVYRFEIALADRSASGRRHRSVVLRQALFAPDRDRGEAQARELLSGAGALAFRYFGSVRDQEAPAWHEEWPRADALPELIELSMVLAGRRSPAFQPLVVELRLRSRQHPG